MADEQDELAALYGDLEDTGAATAVEPSGAGGNDAGNEDDDLFMQLYGDQPDAAEELEAKPFDPYAAAKAEVHGK